MPYDLPILGYDSDVVDRLRTWSAVLPQNFNLEKFSAGDYNGSTEDSNSIAAQISKVLYPEDNTYNGKKLRLMQEYFLVSATLQYAIKDFKRVYGTDMSQLPEKVAFHINDTHPAMVIPELMRILVDEERLPWEEAERITQATVAYTNHTIMAEALEKWPENMMRETLPRIYSIMQELNRRLCQKLFDAFPGQWDRIGHMAILAYDQGAHGEHVRGVFSRGQRRFPAARRYPQAHDVCGLLLHHAGEVLRDHQRHHAAPLADAGQPGALRAAG